MSSIGPATEEYREIQIRYGYSASKDIYYGRFFLPDSRQAPGEFQQMVSIGLSAPHSSSGENCVQNSSVKSFLDGIHKRIDEFLDG